MPAPKGNTYWKDRGHHGRPPIFSTPGDLWAACMAYFDWVEDHPLHEGHVAHYQGKVHTVPVPRPRAMTLRGLCLHMGISRSTWDAYAATEGFSAISTRAREIIWVWKLELAAANLLNVALIARELGLMDRKSVNRHETVSADNSVMALLETLPLSPSRGKSGP